jgi:mannose-6-phosphate isomerase-like protein (cupin superfamily)
MRRYRLEELPEIDRATHAFSSLLPGRRLRVGGLAFHGPGFVTHDEDRPHTHTDAELFCLLQGEGWIDLNGVREPVRAGDLLVIEPGEDHHLISSEENPFINLWLHADDEGHPEQFPSDVSR